jgi:hypothetical protein
VLTAGFLKANFFVGIDEIVSAFWLDMDEPVMILG